MLDNREIAFGFIILLLIILVITIKEARHSAYNILKTFFSGKLLVVFLLAISYIIFSILLLFEIGFWDHSLIVESFIWGVIGGLPLVIKVFKTKNVVIFFKAVLLEHFKLLAFVEFIVGVYTFSLWGEIFLTIFGSIVVILKLTSEKDSKYSDVTKLLNIGLGVLGLFLFINIFKQLYLDYTTLFNVGNLKKLLLPVFLTGMFIPFIYLIRIYSRYEDLHYVLKRFIKDKQLLHYSFYLTVIHFNLNTNQLKRWRNHFLRSHPKDKHEVLNSIKRLKKLIEKEHAPPIEIAKCKGWYPYSSKDFLSRNDLRTRYYEPHSSEEWLALSEYKIVNSNPIYQNTIHYIVRGDENIVTMLELHLTVVDLSELEQAFKVFCVDVATLYSLALEKNVSNKMLLDIVENLNYTFKVGSYHRVDFTTESLASIGFNSRLVIEIV